MKKYPFNKADENEEPNDIEEVYAGPEYFNSDPDEPITEEEDKPAPNIKTRRISDFKKRRMSDFVCVYAPPEFFENNFDPMPFPAPEKQEQDLDPEKTQDGEEQADESEENGKTE